MSTNPLISVVIPVYNCQHDISFAIDSLLNQGLSDEELEIVIINDGSTDNTKAIIESYEVKHACIKIYHQSNTGLGKTRNIGLAIAKGTYIYFLDADDYVAPHSFKPILEKMLEADLNLVGFRSKNVTTKELSLNENLNEALTSCKIKSGANFIETHNFQNTVWWYICNREFLLKTGLKNAEGNELEDCVFTSNLLFLVKKMIFLPLHIHNYYLRETSIMNSKEPQHYYNMVHMFANTAIGYGSFINKVENDKAMTNAILKRLKARQQWLAFFGLVRAVKSKMKVKEISYILNKMNKADAYPINDFIGDDNNGLMLKSFTFLFNRKYLLYPIVSVYRKIPTKFKF